LSSDFLDFFDGKKSLLFISCNFYEYSFIEGRTLIVATMGIDSLMTRSLTKQGP
jgi:hypothetical protein